jgi:hypothetical protein
MSASSAQALDEFPEYIVTVRGEIEVKVRSLENVFSFSSFSHVYIKEAKM